MRNWFLAMAGCLFFSLSHGDLGELRVNSYLGQKLNAKVVISNLPANVDYSDLSVGLASGGKFKEYGLNFSPELGSLRFEVLEQKHQHLILITSAQAINSPLLSLLLHYRFNNNDFYRQYTLMLDPLGYASAPRHSPVRSETQLPSMANAGPKIKAFASQTEVFEPKIGDVPRIYRTHPHDNLYRIARFEQLAYPGQAITLNQIILALSFKNYPHSHPLSYQYGSGVSVVLPNLSEINRVSQESADAYFLNGGLTSAQRLDLIRRLAHDFSESIVLESADIFSGVVKPSPSLISSPRVKCVADSSSEERVAENCFWLVGLILSGMVFFIYKYLRLKFCSQRFAAKQSVASNYQRLPPGIKEVFSKSSPLDAGPLVTAGLGSIANTISQKLKRETSSDRELITALEQILDFDAGRDDVRCQLLELYLAAKQQAKAAKTYQYLDKHLASDDRLRQTLRKVVGKPGFSPYLTAVTDPVANDALNFELNGFEEQLKVASRYFQSQEYSKARVVLQELAANPNTPQAILLQVQPLLKDLDRDD